MTTFTVIIPTHNHADTLLYSVRSVQWQTCQDFELFIVGDGVPDRTRGIAAKLALEDSRIRFFDFPKGERLGELHRHHALKEAQGRFVAYLGDDDLWLPEHLATLASLLEKCDLAHSMQMEVQPDGSLMTWMFDAHDDPCSLEKMRRSETGFGLSSGAHRLDAYWKLPRGWHPAPVGINTDLYFWLQFLDERWCRYRSHKWPSALHLSSLQRKEWDMERRVRELSAWWDKIQIPAQRDACIRECLLPLHDRMSKESFRGSADIGPVPKNAGAKKPRGFAAVASRLLATIKGWLRR
jgi:glycosyltransferase involved in cell wall biosynthesis